MGDFSFICMFRVLVVDDGIIKEEGTPEEIFSAPKHPRLQDFLAKVL